MLPYLKAAFWASPEIPGLGRFPANAAAAAGFAILGLGHPGFWLLGLGLETAYLALLSTNSRFQRLVEARASSRAADADEAKHRALVQSLAADPRERLRRLEQKCERVLAVFEDVQPDDPLLETNREALRRFAWMFLKLLVAQHHLQSADREVDEARLRHQIAGIESELARSGLSDSLRDSKQATLRALRQRLENVARRSEALAEIESDLTRIEAEVELALEDAGMRGKPAPLTGHIDLVSRLLEDSYGPSSADVAALEQRYAGAPPLETIQH